MILKSEIQNLYINWLDEFHNMDINSALNIVQFVENMKRFGIIKLVKQTLFEQQINNQKVD